MNKDSIKNMLIEGFGAVIEPGIVAAVAATNMDNPLAGIFATAFFSSVDSYRYTRAKKNFDAAIEDLYSKFERVEALPSDSKNETIKEQLFPLFWDYVVDEQEIDKIQLFVNGVVTAVSKEEIDMERMFVYFDILKNLRLKEIHYFIDVYINKNFKVIEGQGDVEYPEDLDIAYHFYVLNKLERLGLIHLSVLSGNGTSDDHYKITNLGDGINNYFNTL